MYSSQRSLSTSRVTKPVIMCVTVWVDWLIASAEGDRLRSILTCIASDRNSILQILDGRIREILQESSRMFWTFTERGHDLSAVTSAINWPNHKSLWCFDRYANCPRPPFLFLSPLICYFFHPNLHICNGVVVRPWTFCSFHRIEAKYPKFIQILSTFLWNF